MSEDNFEGRFSNVKEYYENITLTESFNHIVNKIISIIENYIIENKDKIKRELLEKGKKIVEKSDRWSSSKHNIIMTIKCHDEIKKAISETILDEGILFNENFINILNQEQNKDKIYAAFRSNHIKIDIGLNNNEIKQKEKYSSNHDIRIEIDDEEIKTHKSEKTNLWTIELSFQLSTIFKFDKKYYDSDATKEMLYTFIEILCRDSGFKYILDYIDNTNICDLRETIYNEIYHKYICRGIPSNECTYSFDIPINGNVNITKKSWLGYFESYLPSLLETVSYICANVDENVVSFRMHFDRDLKLPNYSFRDDDILSKKLNRLFCENDSNMVCNDCERIDKKYGIKNNGTSKDEEPLTDIRIRIAKNDAENLARDNNTIIIKPSYFEQEPDDEAYIVLSKTVLKTVIDGLASKKDDIKKQIAENLTYAIIDNTMFGKDSKNDKNNVNPIDISNLPLNAYYLENINYKLDREDIGDYYECYYGESYVILDDETNRYINNILTIGNNSSIKYMVTQPYHNIDYYYIESKKGGKLCVFADSNIDVLMLNKKNRFDSTIINLIHENYATIVKHRDILVKEYLNAICKHINMNKAKCMYKLQMERIKKIRELYVLEYIKPRLSSSKSDEDSEILMLRSLVGNTTSSYYNPYYSTSGSPTEIYTDGGKKYYRYDKTKDKKNKKTMPHEYSISVIDVIKNIKNIIIINININSLALKLISSDNFMTDIITKAMNKKIGTSGYTFKIYSTEIFDKTTSFNEDTNDSNVIKLPYSFKTDFVVNVYPSESELIDKIRIEN